MPVQASEEISFVPGIGLSYQFGGNSAQTALAFSAGWQNFGSSEILPGRQSIDLLKLRYAPRQRQIQWAVAGLALDDNAAGSAGMSRGQKWAIGLGIAAAAGYLIVDKAGDAIDDELRDGAKDVEFRPAPNNDDNDSEPRCFTFPVCL